MLNFSTSFISKKSNFLGYDNTILNFSSSTDVKGLFDHRTNPRAHPGRGGSPRG
jgi:hypothetical protein